MAQEWLDFVIIVCLLLLSGFFSGAETALTAASRPRLRQKARAGESRALLVERLQASKERFIGALLFANNLVNITASVLATSVCLRLFGDAGLALATFGMTIAIFVFAEMLPKSWAIHHPLRTAMIAAPVVSVLTRLLSPMIRLFAFVTRLMSRPREAMGSDEEELRGAIELHAQQEDSGKQERAMLKGILDLDDVNVSDIMVHRQDVFSLDESRSASFLLKEVAKHPFTRIPLWRERPENIVSILHVKTLFNLFARRKDKKLDEALIEKASASPWFIPETTSLLKQLQRFRERKEHFALVVDEYGDFMGIVTLEDILEEIVGDIEDESDVTKKIKGIVPLEDGSVRVAGHVTIRDLNRHLDWSLPDEDAATIAGLLIHEARVFPKNGRVFSFYDYLFEVVRCRRNQILDLTITPPKVMKSPRADNHEYGQSPPPV